jgi:chromosome condensin MukBEF MukE localization factor
MDIAARKLELMDWLLHINDESKLRKIIALKSVLDKEVVAHTISGYPVDKVEYINMVKEVGERISSGKYTTIEDLEKENDTFDKLEKILKKEKLEKIGVPSEHKDELDKRLESYRENPQDLLDWDEVKKDW